MMELAEEKARLRRALLAQRAALAPAWAEAHGRAAQERLLATAEFARAAAVGCYLALGREVGTDAILRACRERGRRVCVPARGPDGRYALCWLEAGEALARGPLGVAEPAQRRPAAPGEVDVVVTPGVAFDTAGRRLGRGGGHYDRLLSAWLEAAERRPWLVGLAYEFQIVERVPATAADVAVDAVATDERIIVCGAAERRRKEAQPWG